MFFLLKVYQICFLCEKYNKILNLQPASDLKHTCIRVFLVRATLKYFKTS